MKITLVNEIVSFQISQYRHQIHDIHDKGNSSKSCDAFSNRDREYRADRL